MPPAELSPLRRRIAEAQREYAVALRAPPAPQAADSYVYFIRRGRHGPIKIGRARDPERRLAELQIGSDRPLRIIAKTPGGDSLEKQLHREFAAHRRSGEWFAACPELLARIRELAHA